MRRYTLIKYETGEILNENVTAKELADMFNVRVQYIRALASKGGLLLNKYSVRQEEIFTKSEYDKFCSEWTAVTSEILAHFVKTQMSH